LAAYTVANAQFNRIVFRHKNFSVVEVKGRAF
jgi:hypothetical protein